MTRLLDGHVAMEKSRPFEGFSVLSSCVLRSAGEKTLRDLSCEKAEFRSRSAPSAPFCCDSPCNRTARNRHLAHRRVKRHQYCQDTLTPWGVSDI